VLTSHPESICLGHYVVTDRDRQMWPYKLRGVDSGMAIRVYSKRTVYFSSLFHARQIVAADIELK